MFKIDLILKEWSAIFSFFELKKYCIIFRKGVGKKNGGGKG